MASLALRLNDPGLRRLELPGRTAVKDAQLRIEAAKHWLRGACQEIAIGLFSRLYGLPVPGALARALAEEETVTVAVQPPRAVAAQIPSEVQWVRTAEIFASATSGADAAVRLHVSAAEQIDAASYAFDLLLQEIGPLMIYTQEDEELDVRRFERPAAPARAPQARQTRRELPEHAAA